MWIAAGITATFAVAYVIAWALCRMAALGDRAQEKDAHGERIAMQMRETDWRWPS